MKTNIHLRSYLARFFLEWERFQTNVVEKIKTRFVFSNIFFSRKSCRLWDNVEKYCIAGQATDYNMTHARCMPYNWGYKHTLTICNTCCFPTATMVAGTMVAGTRLIVTLYVHCLVTETDCVYCAVRTKFCQTIHQCSVISFIRILILLEAGPSLATFKISSAVPDDGGALDRVELRHCWLKKSNKMQLYADIY